MPNDYRDAQPEIRDDREGARYEILLDGQLAGFAQYRLHKGRITFFHTEISDEWGGRGLGGRLVQAALEDSRKQGLEVVPMCPFVAAFIKNHSEKYLDLVVPSLRERVMRDG
jgi:hypothetical protein